MLKKIFISLLLTITLIHPAVCEEKNTFPEFIKDKIIKYHNSNPKLLFLFWGCEDNVCFEIRLKYKF